MKNYTVSKALGNIPDDLLLEAMKYEKKRQPAMKILRVAACLAVVIGLLTAAFWPGTEEDIVTGPGLLTIRACATENQEYEEIILKEGIILPAKFDYRIDYNVAQVLPINLSLPDDAYPDMDITFEISTMDGIFAKNVGYDPDSPKDAPDATWLERIVGSYYGQHFTVPNNTHMNWTPWGMNYDFVVQKLKNGAKLEEIPDEQLNRFFSNNPSYVDIVIRADEYIVGYSVIEIREVNGTLGPYASDFTIQVLKIVSFPLVNGRLQKVSEQYVHEQIEWIKNVEE